MALQLQLQPSKPVKPLFDNSRYFYLSFFLVGVSVEIVSELILYLRAIKLENQWNSAEIGKYIASSKKLRTTKIENLKIGDLVMVKNTGISPVDILVVATSDSRHGENIFYTNERRFDGQNTFCTKRTVRNLESSSGL